MGDSKHNYTPAGGNLLSGFWKNHQVILLVFIVHIVVWGFLDQFFTPHPDYIDHWMQSRVFSLSYYEHPPMVAWFIQLVISIFGTSEIGFEAAALFANLVIIGVAYAIASTIFDKRAGIFTLLGLECTPFFIAKSSAIQTEQPLALFWMFALFAIWKYQQNNKFRWILIAGFFAGCGALSKYTMLFFYVSLFIYFALVKSRRWEWINVRQYIGGLVALAVFSPVLIWNGMNDWVSFRFQLAKSGGADDLIFGQTTAIFLIGTVVLYSCVLVVFGGWLMIQKIRRGELKDKNGYLQDSPELLLMVFTLIPIILFSFLLLNSDYTDSQWAVISMVTFFIWLGGESSKLWDKGKTGLLRKVYSLAFGVNIILFIILFLHLKNPLVEFETIEDPAYHLTGWVEMITEVEQFLEKEGIPQPDYVISRGYTLASQFSLHLPSQPRSYSITRIRRNLWSDPLKMNRENTILVCDRVAECKRLENSLGRATGFKAAIVKTFEMTIRGQYRFLSLYRITGRDFNLLEDGHRDHRLPYNPSN